MNDSMIIREVVDEKGAWLVALEVRPVLCSDRGRCPLAAVKAYVEQQKGR